MNMKKKIKDAVNLVADRVVKIRGGKVSSIKHNMHPLSADEISW